MFSNFIYPIRLEKLRFVLRKNREKFYSKNLFCKIEILFYELLATFLCPAYCYLIKK